MNGKVYLVGGGPGDAGLLTCRGKELLGRAGVVVYDALVGEAVLAMIPPGTRRINVGKRSGNHTCSQDEINHILLDEARKGNLVVRLQGGDPFLFGRGGEELALLAEHGVPFEVVPGVTSALAAPAYAGIPVTHRDYASSLHIITGHAREGAALDIDFEALVRVKGTLIFLMGVTAMPAIVRGLLAAGMDPATPAAMIENGTLPSQRRCDASLAELPEQAARMGIGSPALIVVGSVCALASELCWFDRLPLRGRRILVTRPKERAGTLSEKLRRAGAEVVEFPCIEIQPIRPCPAMEAAVENISGYEWLAFTSPAGVEVFWNCLRGMGKDARALGPVKLAAIGSATAKALEHCGLTADLIPNIYDAAHLGDALAECAAGKVLLLRAEMGSAALPEALERACVSYDDIPIYTTSYRHPCAPALREELEKGKFDYVTFTSASTVKGFVSAVGQDMDFSRFVGLCIGKQTAAEAEKYGISVKIAEKASIDALVELAGNVNENI